MNHTKQVSKYMCVCTRVCVYVRVYMYLCTYIYIYIYMPSYTHYSPRTENNSFRIYIVNAHPTSEFVDSLHGSTLNWKLCTGYYMFH
jgi:hypothetical protein